MQSTRTRSLIVCILLLSFCRVDAKDLPYYLPAGTAYDGDVPTPAATLGYEVGDWHVRHDQLVQYYRTLAGSSPRLTLEEYGATHENRPLLLATISSPRNLERIDEIRRRHLAALQGLDEQDNDDDRPVIIWMGYSVHGNEPSGSNASLLVAYHLAAARGEKIDEMLENAVILIDPCINPDGFSRFAQWANSHRGKNLVADPSHREHREVWPGGRTNHYWFDLNRDWLLLTHPESRGRLEKFHAWKPNVVTDFHEMGTNSTFFFQPGVPSRQNPETPARNLELTRELADYHARALDKAGSLYFTEERFDDFYFGKGSTYPDINGGIGILFEQASSRGHLQESSYGLLSFPFTIRNQFITSLSTLDGSLELRAKLLAYQREFYRTVEAKAARDPVRAYVFHDSNDRGRIFHFLDILRRHQIKVHRLAREIDKDGERFSVGSSWVVPLAQPQYRLVRALFTRPTEFEDSTFYDVSAWTLPLSFDLPCVELGVTEYEDGLLGVPLDRPEPAQGTLSGESRPYAYLFGWNEYYAPRAANRLLESDVRLRAATRPFTIETKDGERSFEPGTIIVPVGIQKKSAKEIASLMTEIAGQDGVDIHAVRSGLTSRGIDLGSPSVSEVKRPRPLLIVGPGVSSYEAGAVWHLLDASQGMELSMVEISQLEGLKLERYSHCILVSGDYKRVPESAQTELRRWIRRGGVMVATRGSLRWVEAKILQRKKPGGEAQKAGAKENPTQERPEKTDKTEAPEKTKAPEKTAPTYADYDRLRAEKTIRGTIFEASIDRTHPLGFGYERATLAVFRNTTVFMKPEKDPIATVVRYTDTPLLGGFVSPENLAKVRGSAVVCATRLGRGVVVRITDDLTFRGVWYGTSKLFLNTLFFGGLIRDTSRLEGDGRDQHAADDKD